MLIHKKLLFDLLHIFGEKKEADFTNKNIELPSSFLRRDDVAYTVLGHWAFWQQRDRGLYSVYPYTTCGTLDL